MTEEEVYGVLKETGALLRGHFELRSGLHSPEFFQCANLLRFPRKAEALCSALAALLPEAAVREATTVVSPALGGILVGHEVARALDKKCIFAEKVPSAYYQLGTTAPGKPYYPVHHGKMVPDEKALSIGMEVMVNCALKFLNS